MHKRLIVRLAAPLLAAMLTVLAATPGFGQSKQAENSSPMPKVGQMAPDFTLNYFDGNDLKPISLSQYRGKKNVVVAFFIFAFTGG
ncbi:MAG TPA: redoxin domain-containing protein [Candidatus Sulfotelmatobacter sp.]|jgi:cytochrome oxidase Cu insertion factor (SCO1/SenC/PrrC family)